MKKKTESAYDIDLLTNLQNKEEQKRKQRRNRRFRLALFSFVLLIILLGYLYSVFFSENAKIKQIKISNNRYFTDRQVLSKAAIDYNDNFYFTAGRKVEKRFADWEICKVKVLKNANQVLEIRFENADLLAYYSDQEANLWLLDSSNRSYAYDNQYLEALKSLPFLLNYNQEERRMLVENLKLLDRGIIAQISEITRYATSFDENMIKLTMEDGITVYLDYLSVPMLNSYNEIVAPLSPTNRCLYFDKATGMAIATNCQED